MLGYSCLSLSLFAFFVVSTFLVVVTSCNASSTSSTTTSTISKGCVFGCSSCRSNATHVSWQRPDWPADDCDCGRCCEWQTWREAEEESYNYLRKHLQKMDLLQLSTLGFHDDNDNKENSSLPDGLSDGLVGPTIEYALKAKVTFAYCDELPKSIWQEYVLSYSTLNEGRTNWRPFLWNKLMPLFSTRASTSSSSYTNATGRINITMSDVVKTLNAHMWKKLALDGTNHSSPSSSSIRFVASQTPLIVDPMSVLVFGYASCTGLAVLFVAALRTVGIPARVAGTPAWNDHRASGNHNWVEILWHDQHNKNDNNNCNNNNNQNNVNTTSKDWYFLEPTPQQESNPDHLERDPCQRWFCNRHYFPSNTDVSHNNSKTNNKNNATQVLAARLDATQSHTFFRLAWDWNYMDIPANDRTAFYQQVCSTCGGGHDKQQQERQSLASTTTTTTTA